MAVGIAVLCPGAHESMKKRRRGSCNPMVELGSLETWKFG